jgi:putative membrane protein
MFTAVACNSGSSTTESTDSTTNNTSSTTGSANPGGTGTTAMGDSGSAMKTGSTNDTSSAMTANDFISKNIIDNNMELQLIKMGRDKATNAQVKKAATQMMTDHTQMLSDLKTLAGKKQVTVPAANTADMSAMPSLSGATGKEFDQAWASEMLTMHEAKLNELQNVLSQTQDADIKALATKALPKIKMHRDMLSKITTSTGSTQPQ